MQGLPNKLVMNIFDYLPPGSVVSSGQRTSQTTSSETTPIPTTKSIPIESVPQYTTPFLNSMRYNGGGFFQENVLGKEVALGAMTEAQRMLSERASAFKQGGVGAGGSVRLDKVHRGDKITFLSSDELAPAFQPIIEYVKRCVQGLPMTKLSIQLAVYPGDGVGYTKHRDAWLDDESDRHSEKRRLTFLYFLNDGWVSSHGGHLVVNGVMSVPPKLDTIAVFPSYFEHEVEAPFAPRMALGIWVYGTEPLATFPARPIATPCRFSVTPKRMWNDPSVSTIFVSIADYCDPEIEITIQSLFEAATAKHRIFVGVVHQTITAEISKIPASLEKNIRRIRIPHTMARGPCYARYLGQSLYDGEEFYLQIDAHMRFAKGWDNMLIDWLGKAASLTGSSSLPVLTAYPPEISDDLDVVADMGFGTRLVASAFEKDSTDPTVQVLRIKGEVLTTSATAPPVPCGFVAAGCFFTVGRVVWECPYDPNLEYVFFGEEQSMALRLFTHGYRFFSPPRSVIQHRWSRKERPTFWQMIAEEKKEITAKKNLSMRRIQSIFKDGVGSGCVEQTYGLGSLSTLKEYEQYCGVNFSTYEIN
eukprot:PhF_6_TR35364/c0_g1_i1/m.51347